LISIITAGTAASELDRGWLLFQESAFGCRNKSVDYDLNSWSEKW
jgi:hypothetical protein